MEKQGGKIHMKETYNLKIKEYDTQTTVSLYKKSIIIRDELENAIIQLKRFRCSIISNITDLGNGLSKYTCDETVLEDKIKEIITDKNLQSHYSYIKSCVPCSYITETVNDYEKHERSTIISLSRTKKAIYDYAYANDWTLFVTLTFDDNILLAKYGKSAADYDTCVKCLHIFFTVLKRQCPELQYLGVPELHHYYYDSNNNAVVFNGEKLNNEIYYYLLNKPNRTVQEQDIINKVAKGVYKRRFHFHFLFHNYPEKFLVDSLKRDKKGRIIYNLTNYKLGFTTATVIDSLEASQHYITKYISKDLVELSKGKKRYWTSKNLKKPVENTYCLEDHELRSINADLTNVIESDTRYKVISVENGEFKNKICYGVILNGEIFKTESLIDYLNLDLGVIRHYHYKNFQLQYDNADKNNQHYTHPCASLLYWCHGYSVPDRPLDYLANAVIRSLNEELQLRTRPNAFSGKVEYVPEEYIYFTVDDVFCKAVLENGEYVYHKL